jgi:UDP-N-acetylglucosamine 2-epimerase (non-hydrolysing)
VASHSDYPHIAVVVGTRPEIVKLAPIVRMLGPSARFLHTGQHTDIELSGVFLKASGLPQPEALDGICGQPRHAQVGRMVEQLGAMFADKPPRAVLVQGDTNTASAAAQAGTTRAPRSCT